MHDLNSFSFSEQNIFLCGNWILWCNNRIQTFQMENYCFDFFFEKYWWKKHGLAVKVLVNRIKIQLMNTKIEEILWENEVYVRVCMKCVWHPGFYVTKYKRRDSTLPTNLPYSLKLSKSSSSLSVPSVPLYCNYNNKNCNRLIKNWLFLKYKNKIKLEKNWNKINNHYLFIVSVR